MVMREMNSEAIAVIQSRENGARVRMVVAEVVGRGWNLDLTEESTRFSDGL